MSLDNIQLPAMVIAGLFKNSIVDLDNGETTVTTAAVPEKEVVFLGGNNRKITIIVWDESAIYLAEESLTFLMGILSACKLTMEDVALVNAAKNTALSYQNLHTQLQAENLLLFGVTPQQLELPLAFPQYQIQKYNGQSYLAAPPLTQLAQDKAEKTKLWNCLKQLFSIA